MNELIDVLIDLKDDLEHQVRLLESTIEYYKGLSAKEDKIETYVIKTRLTHAEYQEILSKLKNYESYKENIKD